MASITVLPNGMKIVTPVTGSGGQALNDNFELADEKIQFLDWQIAVESLSQNTVALDASTAHWQVVEWTSGSRVPTFAGFDGVYRSFLLEIDVSDEPTVDWTNVDQWWTENGEAPDLDGLTKIRVIFDSQDDGTTINATLAGAY